jgi:hypothetical protein
MSRLLTELGFASDELHACQPYSDGRVIISAVIVGEPARLILDTGQNGGLILSYAYVRARGLPYERDAERWGKSPIDQISVLGATHLGGSTWVRGADEETEVYHTVGTLGIQYIPGALLAIDPVEWTIGISDRAELRDGLARARHRVPLCGDVVDDLPVTSALAESKGARAQPVLLVDTGRPRSVLSLQFTSASWTGRWRRWIARRASRRGKRIYIAWRFPDGERLTIHTAIIDGYDPGYGPDDGVERIHGALGLDFLYQWLPVFDFPGARARAIRSDAFHCTRCPHSFARKNSTFSRVIIRPSSRSGTRSPCTIASVGTPRTRSASARAAPSAVSLSTRSSGRPSSAASSSTSGDFSWQTAQPAVVT